MRHTTIFYLISIVAVIKETDIYQNEIVEYTFFQNYVYIKTLPIVEVVSIY